MLLRSPYDLDVAFDDLYDHGSPQGVPSFAEEWAASRIQDRLRAERIALPTPYTFTLPVEDRTTTVLGFFIPLIPILGEMESESFPLFQRIRAKFARALPKPRVVRVDTDRSYRDFRDARRAPYRDQLARCAGLLREACARADAERRFEDLAEYGVLDFSPASDEVEVIGEATRCAGRDLVCGGQSIPPPFGVSPRKAAFWIDRDEICGSVRVLGEDGRPRVLTSGTPVSVCLDDAVSCAIECGESTLEDALPGVLGIATRAGAERLLVDLCGVARLDPRGITQATPRADAAIAAGMTILQRARRGDLAAEREVDALLGVGGGKGLLAEAGDRLAEAYRDRNRRDVAVYSPRRELIYG